LTTDVCAPAAGPRIRKAGVARRTQLKILIPPPMNIRTVAAEL
jgi:hypothetical protein